jgi:hypothetical protein
MNIFRKQQRQQALKNIEISSDDMLDLYRLYKSIELYLIGDYDYLKYKRLKNLTKDSFAKESGDLKLAVRALSLSHRRSDQLLSMQRCILVALHYLVRDTPREKTARCTIYDFNNVSGSSIFINNFPVNEIFIVENIDIMSFEFGVVQKAELLCTWVKSFDKTTNENFFK